MVYGAVTGQPVNTDSGNADPLSYTHLLEQQEAGIREAVSPPTIPNMPTRDEGGEAAQTSADACSTARASRSSYCWEDSYAAVEWHTSQGGLAYWNSSRCVHTNGSRL